MRGVRAGIVLAQWMRRPDVTKLATSEPSDLEVAGAVTFM
jgi:hypothetical protein